MPVPWKPPSVTRPGFLRIPVRMSCCMWAYEPAVCGGKGASKHPNAYTRWLRVPNLVSGYTAGPYTVELVYHLVSEGAHTGNPRRTEHAHSCCPPIPNGRRWGNQPTPPALTVLSQHLFCVEQPSPAAVGRFYQPNPQLRYLASWSSSLYPLPPQLPVRMWVYVPSVCPSVCLAVCGCMCRPYACPYVGVCAVRMPVRMWVVYVLGC